MVITIPLGSGFTVVLDSHSIDCRFNSVGDFDHQRRRISLLWSLKGPVSDISIHLCANALLAVGFGPCLRT
jgi:hypothetical protein